MLKEIIQLVPGWPSKSPEELLSDVNSPKPGVPNHDLQTWSGLGLALGSQESVAIVRLKAIQLLKSETLPQEQQALLDYAHSRLENNGIDLAENQEMVDALAPLLTLWGVDPNEIKRIGIPMVSDAQRALSRDATLEEVQAAKNQLVLEMQRQAELDFAINRMQLFREAISVWDGQESSKPVL